MSEDVNRFKPVLGHGIVAIKIKLTIIELMQLVQMTGVEISRANEKGLTPSRHVLVLNQLFVNALKADDENVFDSPIFKLESDEEQ